MKRRIVSWLWVIAGVVLISRSASNIYRLWKAGERVTQAEGRLAGLKQENEQLNRELTELQTPEYMERLVREKLGYGRPGEVVLVVPDGQVESGNPPAGRAGLKVESEKVPNWKQWRRLYLGF